MATGGALFVSSLIWCRPPPSELVNTSAEISFEDELLQRVRRCCCCVDSGWPWKTHGTENTSTHSTAHTRNSYTSETLRDLTGPFFISLPSHPAAVSRKKQKWSWHTKWPLIPVFELPAKQRSIRLCQVLFCFLWPMNTAESSGERGENLQQHCSHFILKYSAAQLLSNSYDKNTLWKHVFVSCAGYSFCQKCERSKKAT